MTKLHSRVYGWKHVWSQFSDEHKGEVDDPNPDSSHEKMSIFVPIKDTPWVVIYTMIPGGKGRSDHTQVDVSYKPQENDSFTFAIYPEHFHHGFKKLLGMQDIIIGHDDFDKAFIIKGNDPDVVVQMFADEKLRELILVEPTLQLWAHCDNADSSPSSRALREDHNILSLRLKGAVDDFERLKTIHSIIHRTLGNLCKLKMVFPN